MSTPRNRPLLHHFVRLRLVNPQVKTRTKTNTAAYFGAAKKPLNLNTSR